MTVINSNIPALIATNSLRINAREMNQAMQRLSTGKRINSAQDDPAGSMVASKLEAASRAERVGIRNTNHAISMLQTYASAGQAILNVVTRMKELAVQGSTGTLSINDRLGLDTEYYELGREWGRIASETSWNGFTGMASFNSGFTVRIGGSANASSTVTIPLRNWTPSDETANENVTGATTLSSDDASANPLEAFEFVRDHPNLDATPVANMRSHDHIQSMAAASASATKLKTAITGMSRELAHNGAYINRLQISANTQTVIATALESSRSKVEDADYAAETTKLSRTQIISQAATAMLAQANAGQQSVLALLQ